MSPDDLTPDDEPLDITLVSADDALVEQLRHALSPDNAVVWDDDDEDDPGYALLRALQRDVSTDLPEPAILPSEVTPLVPRRRHLSRTATVAVLTAGALSIGGVAAASAPGGPLADMRSAVSSAVSDVVDAITPDTPVGPVVAAASKSPHPSVQPTPPGDAVSTAARSASAIAQVEANLDRAASLMDKGRYAAAEAQLTAARRKLLYVLAGADSERLTLRLIDLQTRLAAGPAGKTSPQPDDKGAPAGKGKSASAAPRSSSAPSGGAGATPDRRPDVVPTRGAESRGSDAGLGPDIGSPERSGPGHGR